VVETFGNVSVSDSLYAIRTLVLDEGALSITTLLETLYADFVGHERVRSHCRRVPKYGNDHPKADAMYERVNRIICEAAWRQADGAGLHTFLAVLVNNDDHVRHGTHTGASADGRGRGRPLSKGNQPTAGCDVAGLIALLRSMTRLDPRLHAGATQNLKLSRELFSDSLAAVSAAIKGFFASGGTQIMITVTDRAELEAAMRETESHGHARVRVGGYSERFIDLSADVPKDILERTL
jgi:pyruvate-formate lyase